MALWPTPIEPMTCPHGFPSPANCGTCIADGWTPPAKATRPAGVVRTLTAQYGGHCDRCGESIERGDEIALMDDDSYEHAEHQSARSKP